MYMARDNGWFCKLCSCKAPTLETHHLLKNVLVSLISQCYRRRSQGCDLAGKLKSLRLDGLYTQWAMGDDDPDLWAKATALTHLEFCNCALDALPELQAATGLKSVRLEK